MKNIFFAIVLLVVFNNIIANAQSCDSVGCTCTVDDLNPAGIMIGHGHPKGYWKVSYRYMNMMMKGNLFGTNSVSDNTVFNNYIMSPQSMRMDMHMIMAMYGVTNKFSVMAMFNYNVLSMQMNMFPVTTMNMSASGAMTMSKNNPYMTSNTNGMGDLKLYAVYELLNQKNHSLFLSGGVSVPTGSINVKGNSNDMMYPSQRLPYMMQLGSGTYDFMPGLTYLIKYNGFLLGTQATSVVSPFYNSFGYHLGNQLNLNCWAAYKWLPWISTSVRVQDSYTAPISGSDAQLTVAYSPSANPANYGGQLVNGYAGINIYFNKSFLRNSKLSAEYGIPMYQCLNGIQLETKSTVFASWVFSF